MAIKNADLPAHPLVALDSKDNPVPITTYGLTKREIMAMHMMAALLVGCESPNNDFIASIAVDATEKLLAELDRTSK